MKKFLSIFAVLLIAATSLTLCACNFVPSTRFLSKHQVNKLAKEFDKPQAEMTLNYTTSNDKEVEVKITYDLLLTQTPLATIRFIQLVNEGFYNETVIDTYNKTDKYMVLGRYLYKDSKVQKEGTKVYIQNVSDKTFKGEFESNGYREPKDGYAQFKIFSLGMYHDAYTEENNNFDSANGYLIFAMANQTLNPANYAVFAQMASVSFKRNAEAEATVYTKVPSDLLDQLTSFTGTNTPSKTSSSYNGIYTDDSETNTVSPAPSVMSTVVTVHIRMLGDYDWSKLPTVGR